MLNPLRLTPSQSTPGTSSASTIDGQKAPDNVGSTESIGPAASAVAKQQFSGIPKSPKGGDQVNPSLESRFAQVAAQTALTSEDAVQQIKNMPINDINNLNDALKVAEKVNVDFRHEPMRAVADKLIFLSRQDSPTGREAFIQKAKPFICDGNELDQAIKFFDWSRSVSTRDQPNLPNNLISDRQGDIESRMRDRVTEMKAVELVVFKYGPFNSHDTDLLVQHARGLELNGLPNLPHDQILSRLDFINWYMRRGTDAGRAVKYMVTEHGTVSGHDMDLFVQHAEGFKLNALPNLSDDKISSSRGHIELSMRRGENAEKAVKLVVETHSKVNSHDMNLFVEYARGLELNGLPNLSGDEISSRKGEIDWFMKRDPSASKAVERVANRRNQVNSHDMDLLVQHAKGREVNGMPNLDDLKISNYLNCIECDMREGKTASEAVDWVVNRHGPLNSHDMNLFVEHARGWELNGLPNLPIGKILGCKNDIKRYMKSGKNANEAVAYLVKNDGQVNKHDMDLLVAYANDLEVNGLPKPVG